MAVKNCFIRGSVVRYVQIPASGIDTQLLEDATRRGKRVTTVTEDPLSDHRTEAATQTKR